MDNLQVRYLFPRVSLYQVRSWAALRPYMREVWRLSAKSNGCVSFK